MGPTATGRRPGPGRIFRRMKSFLTYRIAATLQLLVFFFIALFAFPTPDSLPASHPCLTHWSASEFGILSCYSPDKIAANKNILGTASRIFPIFFCSSYCPYLSAALEQGGTKRGPKSPVHGLQGTNCRGVISKHINLSTVCQKWGGGNFHFFS